MTSGGYDHPMSMLAWEAEEGLLRQKQPAADVVIRAEYTTIWRGEERTDQAGTHPIPTAGSWDSRQGMGIREWEDERARKFAGWVKNFVGVEQQLA